MHSSRNIDTRAFAGTPQQDFKTKKTPGYIVIEEQLKQSIPRRGLLVESWTISWLHNATEGGSNLSIAKSHRGRHAGSSKCPKNWFLV